MDDQDRHKRNQEKLFYGGIIFGITIAIGFFIVIHFGSQIEFEREHSSFLININSTVWLLPKINGNR